MNMLEFTDADADPADALKLWVFPDEIAAVLESLRGAVLLLRSGASATVTTPATEVVRMLGEVFED